MYSNNRQNLLQRQQQFVRYNHPIAFPIPDRDLQQDYIPNFGERGDRGQTEDFRLEFP